MDFTALLGLFNLVTLTYAGTFVAVLTTALKAMPTDWFSDRPKITAWVVSAVVVTIVGLYAKASAGTIVEVTLGVALISHGLYDVAVGAYKGLSSLFAKLFKSA